MRLPRPKRVAGYSPTFTAAGRNDERTTLIIAATAVATSRTVLTTDRNARFGDLPGVDFIVVS